MKLRFILFVLSLLAFLSAVAGGYFYYSSLRDAFFDEAKGDALAHIHSTNMLVSQYISDYTKIVDVLSRLDAIRSALKAPTKDMLESANTILDRFQQGGKVNVCYLMDQTGQTIASSNRFAEDSFVGKNYSFRPYFQEAMAGRSTVYMALGVTSGKRGIYFSHPVYDPDSRVPLGVAVIKGSAENIVKRLLSRMGPSHEAQKAMFFIVDPLGVIFFTDRKPFLFKTLWKTTDLERHKIAETRQFGKGPWAWSGFKNLDGTEVIDASGERYLIQEESIKALQGWKIVHLSNLKAISSLIANPLLKTVGYLIIGLCALIGVAIFFLNNLAHAEIVKRKEAEASLKKSETKLRTIIEHSNELFYIHDTAHRLTYASPGSIQLLGYSPNEMLVKWTELATDNPINQKGVEVTEQAIRTGEKQAPYLLELRKKDKSPVLVEIDESPVKDIKGKVTGISGAARDVTQKIKAEQALKKSEQGMKAILRTSPVGIGLVIDRKLDWANETMYRLMGYEEGSLFGENARVLYPDDEEYERVGQGLYAGILRSGTGQAETRWVRKDGTTFDCLIRACSLDATDPSKGQIVVVNDISQAKRLQAQLQRAEKMEAIGTLAGGVAHDLNNILSGLVTYPEVLLMGLPEESPLRKPISTIQKSGEKAAAVVQDLLTLARRGVAVTEVVNLNKIISQYLKSPEYEKLKSFHPGVEAETRFETEILNILGSPVHLSKTVMNLVSNAAEALPEGGRIVLSTKNRYIDRPVRGYEDVVEGDYVVLTVTDRGVGISPEDIKKIFEPFYTKKKMGRSGTGLGMAVVWGTVKDHNGYIDVESTKGKGTTFTLYFPVTRKEQGKDETLISIEDYRGRGESILIVDDVKQQRDIASQMLKALGYSVASVSSGEEAVEYLKTNPVDLLVLDMIMAPGIDGLETYKRIIEFRPGQKAIIASGFSVSERVKEAQRLGAGAYVKKPFLSVKIGPAIRAELDKVRASAKNR